MQSLQIQTLHLRKTAEKVIIPSIPKFENAPGIRSYAVLQMIVYLLAIRMGEVRLKYTMEQANMYRRELKCLPKEFLNNADRICALALEAAKQFKEASQCGDDRLRGRLRNCDGMHTKRCMKQ